MYQYMLQTEAAETKQRIFVGGGYTKNNVARCWTNETAILVGEELSEDLPANVYHEYYQPDYKLNRNTLSTRQLDNQNMRSQIDAIRIAAMEHLRHLSHTPGESSIPEMSREVIPQRISQAHSIDLVT